MGQLTKDQILEEAAARKDRIREMITREPAPVPYKTILALEGMHDRACRGIIWELEAELGIKYLGTPASKGAKDELPYGLTAATAQLRGKLADNLYQLRMRGKDHSQSGRNELAPQIGLNARQQLRAEERPFAHDWTLSQIERLARALGRDPREFLLQCLTT
jgi:hypothetical protein